ncbi:M14 family metallopeptidase [Chondrinema litorale]|uniref:M14 family metallopeptidase n=1 Tax=Chondrinema litorale TaxID=2994555 RepID=UPI0025437213|nr:M14 metallopeptidase family protein [Chondrinema litorale]UZR96600.1 M14 family metallopeptidase [Chondrinema litorale]
MKKLNKLWKLTPKICQASDQLFSAISNQRFSFKKLTLGLALVVMPLFLKAQSSSIPKPEDVIGFKVGADFHLATYEQSISYFEKLDAASDMVEMKSAGKTSEGRDWKYVLISSPENLKNIDHYKEISQKLAHPENLSREEAKKLAEEGKTIVDLSGGLHASEVAGAQHIITLAYEILSKAEEKKFKAILDDVILVLWPSLNPDGQDIIANWYLSNVGTPYETSRTPWLYQKYVGHDNNRDAYMLNMLESRVVGRTWREWEPNIIHVHHQSSPFPTRIWLPPFAEPIATQTPPIVAREVNMIGMAMAQELETEGLPGAVHMGKGFDAWYPGYIDYLPAMQNIPSFWTETALYMYATPHFYTLRDFPKDRADLRVESLYSSPWKGGWWRISDAMQYMQVASIAVLDYAAKYKETLLFNKYQSGVNTIEKYKNEPPFAYFIPQKQRDNVRPVEMLRRLAFNGIEISQLKQTITFEGITYPKGTWVIPMDQEFAELAREVLDVQVYPDLRESPDGPLEQPYDAAGWTLPYQMEVKVIGAMTPITQELKDALEPIEGKVIEPTDNIDTDLDKIDFAPGAGFSSNAIAAGIKPLPGSLKGNGSILLVDPTENNTFRVLAEAKEKGLAIIYNDQKKKYGIKGASRSLMQQWVDDYAINGELTSQNSETDVKTRVAVYRPWTASMDMGWTRWLLDNFGVEYTSIRNTDFWAGNLSDRFDVIVMASERNGTIENGMQAGSAPPQYAGGLGENGSRSLNNFVSKGGTLVCLNQSSEFAINALHLPVQNVVKGVDRAKFFTGGSIMEVICNNEHPVMAGMPEFASVFVFRSPVFATLDGFEGEVLARYQSKGSPLLSGYLVGEEYMNDKAAALDVKHGEGHVLLFGFQPQWRGQPMGTYRTLFNALLYGNEVPKNHKPASEDWLKVK